MSVNQNLNPKSILMIKSHSAGVGDLLRSSAAWRVLKNRWPQAKLHLLFLSKHPGYASEGLMGAHHLLDSCTFLTLREKSPDVKGVSKTPFKRLLSEALHLAVDKEVDCVIDFEMHGLRTSLLTWCLLKGMKKKKQLTPLNSVGVGQFPLRSWFYGQSSASLEDFAKARAKPLPMDYTDRDFVALSALGLERNGIPIELEVARSEVVKARDLLNSFEVKPWKERIERLPVLGLNIGCGTVDALNRRPDLKLIASALVQLFKQQPFNLILTGAPNERDVNKAFLELLTNELENNLNQIQTISWVDLAGETDVLALSAVVSLCNIFVSSDSGPYHIAVALRVPTFCWFVFKEPAAIHNVTWCRHGINPTKDEFVSKVLELFHQNK